MKELVKGSLATVNTAECTYPAGTVRINNIVKPTGRFVDEEGNELDSLAGVPFGFASRNTMAFCYYVDDPAGTVQIIDVKHLIPVEDENA
jgi:hypothetical protein